MLTVILLLSISPVALAADHAEARSAQTLYALGLFKGTGTNADGTPIFDLDKTPTRNQALIMLVRLLGREQEALTGNWYIPFTDVSPNMRAYVGYAYTCGLTSGTSATTYSGSKPIRANQYITFVLRALGYTSGEDFQVSTAWDFSDAIGLTDGAYHAASSSFVRRDVADISASALSVQLKDSEDTLAQKLMDEGVFTQRQYDTTLQNIAEQPQAETPQSSSPYADEETHGTSSGTHSGSGVTVPGRSETEGTLVWVPVHGGTKYHRTPTCSNMIDPIQVSIETATANGYTPCGRCYK